MQDLDGDGKPEWIVNSWLQPEPLHVWRLATAKRTINGKQENPELAASHDEPSLEKIVINKTGNGHGLGVGDINGDGLLDIVCGTGWYECPSADDRFQREWTYHPDWKQQGFSLPVLIRDMDSDGRNDIVWGTAHAFGLQWWQQGDRDKDGRTTWKTHLIDDRFSQAHALAWADLDGDGQGELITGKRVLAHNGNDPGSEMPPCIFYFTWDVNSFSFHRHVINIGVVGTGLQIRTGDLDGDGSTDLAVAGKRGTFLLLNRDR